MRDKRKYCAQLSANRNIIEIPETDTYTYIHPLTRTCTHTLIYVGTATLSYLVILVNINTNINE